MMAMHVRWRETRGGGSQVFAHEACRAAPSGNAEKAARCWHDQQLRPAPLLFTSNTRISTHLLLLWRVSARGMRAEPVAHAPFALVALVVAALAAAAVEAAAGAAKHENDGADGDENDGELGVDCKSKQTSEVRRDMLNSAPKTGKYDDITRTRDDLGITTTATSRRGSVTDRAS